MSDDRVTLSEIARQIGVTLPAVSNWRRRYSSFPLAEEADGKALFTVRDVACWLDGRKISKKDLKPGELPGSTYGARFRSAMNIADTSTDAIDADLWKELIQFRGAEDVAVFADLVLGLLYLAVSDERRWKDIMAADGSQRLSLVELACLAHLPVLSGLHRARGETLIDIHGEIRLAKIIRLVDRMRQSGRGAEVFEFLLDRFAAVEGRRGAAVRTPPAIVRLLVELVAPVSGASVFDPCCGSGEFLVSAAKYIAARGGRVSDASFTGHALPGRSASLARMNIQVHGIPVDVDDRADMIFHGDGTLIANRCFDVIISNPPFDMKDPIWAASMPDLHGRYGSLPRNRTNFAWLQYVVSSLADGGQAAVLMPGRTLFSGGSEKQVRARMIDDGIVEAVVALPPQMFASTGIPVTVWLLSQPAGRREDEVLLIDASDLGHMISRTQRSLSVEDRSRIVDTVARWRAGEGNEDVRGFSASVAIQRIRSQEYVLTPARYVGSRLAPDPPLKSMPELWYELDHLRWRAAEADKAVDRQLDRIRAWIR